MSDTEINYKYKDKIHSDIKTGNIKCDRGVYKSYLDLYNNNNPLYNRFNNCALIAKGNEKGQRFLEDICNHWNSDKSGYMWEYEDKGKIWHEFMKQQEIIELEFDCY